MRSHLTRSVFLLASLSMGLAAQSLIYDNGPLATHPGLGAGGADASALENVAPMSLNVFGFGAQRVGATDNAMTDDFTVCGTWAVNELEFFFYQTGSTTTSTITAVHWQIWNGQPGTAGAAVIAGNIATPSTPSANTFSNIYRTLIGGLTANNRPIMAVKVALIPTLTLAPGVYWLEMQAAGSLASGPWMPPVSQLGVRDTGNALQRIGAAGAWVAANNAAAGTAFAGADMPFKIYGTAAGQILASATLYGAGKLGTNGTPGWSANAPRIGKDVELRISNGFAGSTPVVFYGTAQGNLPFPPLNITILVGPAPAPFLTMPAADATNVSSLRLRLPSGPNLCGTLLTLQGFILDPGASSSLSHTEGLQWIFGN